MNNFATRCISGLVFTAVLVFALIWDRVWFAAIFLFVLYFCLKEFYAMSLGSRFRLSKFLAVLVAVLSFAAVCGYRFFDWDLKWLCLGLLPLLLIPVAALIESDREGVAELALVYAGLLYIALPICLSPFLMMNMGVFDGWLMLSLFILIWVSDVGAYCLGTLFGQKSDSRKLAPKISPKKSWWGFWSGLVFSVAAAVGLHFLAWLPFSLWHCAALGVIVSVGGVCGDLFESLWKRRFGVKDSGSIIPGHGGMLDRFDSSLVAIPMAAVYMALLGLI